MSQRKKKRTLSDENQESEDHNIERISTCVYFHSRVEVSSVIKLLKCISEATEEAKKTYAPYIWLYIHSSGGDAFAGFSAMDHIKNNEIPVVTIADGLVASAATFILLGGARRFTMPTAHILIHQVQSEFSGKYKELLDDVSNTKSLMTTMKTIYTNETFMKKKDLKEWLYKELYMTADQSINFGLVESIYDGYNIS